MCVAEHVVRSFTRGCELRQGRKQSCIEDVHFVTCQSFCRTDLCNIGQGDLNSNQRHYRAKSTITPAPPTTMTSPSSSPSRHGLQRVTRPSRRLRNDSTSTTCNQLTLTINFLTYVILHANRPGSNY